MDIKNFNFKLLFDSILLLTCFGMWSCLTWAHQSHQNNCCNWYLHLDWNYFVVVKGDLTWQLNLFEWFCTGRQLIFILIWIDHRLPLITIMMIRIAKFPIFETGFRVEWLYQLRITLIRGKILENLNWLAYQWSSKSYKSIELWVFRVKRASWTLYWGISFGKCLYISIIRNGPTNMCRDKRRVV